MCYVFYLSQATSDNANHDHPVTLVERSLGPPTWGIVFYKHILFKLFWIKFEFEFEFKKNEMFFLEWLAVYA